jgi:hemoglobin-like flavoprotein
MILTLEEITTLKSSFALLHVEDVNIATCFYDNLFKLAPLIERNKPGQNILIISRK